MLLVAALLIGAWGSAVAWTLLNARNDLEQARAELTLIRDHTTAGELLEPRTQVRLGAVTERLRRAERQLDSALVSPVRLLPVVGRQLRSADAIAGAATDVATITTDVLGEVDDVLAIAEEPATNRAEILAELSQVAASARQELADVDLGPDEGLVGTLRDAHNEFAEELREITELLDTTEVAADALSELLRGPGCHLLLAANNAEMRAGSGMHLQAGELCFDQGEVQLTGLVETSELMLEPEAVAIEDTDLRDRWGFLLPNAEWRNLSLSPRFDANAPLAADMWEVATGRRVEGVIAVDPIALEALLEAIGPIDVDGTTYGPDDVVEQLLVEQYQGFLEPGYDPGERKDQLGEVADAAVAAFDDGGVDLRTLAESLPDAANGRHILTWARDPETQEAWERLGIAGTLEPNSMLLSVLNRGGGKGGGKLDPFLDVAATVEATRGADGHSDVHVQIEVVNTVEPNTPTYVENPDDPDVRFGVYQGIISLNVPGSAYELTIEDRPLLARGPDGESRVVATPVELGPSGRAVFHARFRLPPGVSSIRIEPSARVPATEWRIPGRSLVTDVSNELFVW